MGNIAIRPNNLQGSVYVPASKSFAHRAILCALLAKNICKINNVVLNDDILATIKSVFTLGAKCFYESNSLYMHTDDAFEVENAIFDCEESGSTLRFLIPIVAAKGITSCFCGRGRLPERPIKPYLDILPKFGVSCRSDGKLPLKIDGFLKPGDFEIPGNLSSQFITGFLLALPNLKQDSRIILTSPLESKKYVDMTIEVMKSFSVYVEKYDYGYYIPGNQKYDRLEYTVENDWSQSAFWIIAGLLSQKFGNVVRIKGLNFNSSQGDCEIVNIARKMGGRIKAKGNELLVYPSKLRGCVIDVTNVPDLLPAIAVGAMFAKGQTRIVGAKRLKLKESDRLVATANGINSLGGYAEATDDSIVIEGVKKCVGGIVDSFNDHRIAMAMSLASIRAKDDIILTAYESVSKSYPAFFQDFISLGGDAYVI